MESPLSLGHEPMYEPQLENGRLNTSLLGPPGSRGDRSNLHSPDGASAATSLRVSPHTMLGRTGSQAMRPTPTRVTSSLLLLRSLWFQVTRIEADERLRILKVPSTCVPSGGMLQPQSQAQTSCRVRARAQRLHHPKLTYQLHYADETLQGKQKRACEPPQIPFKEHPGSGQPCVRWLRRQTISKPQHADLRSWRARPQPRVGAHSVSAQPDQTLPTGAHGSPALPNTRAEQEPRGGPSCLQAPGAQHPRALVQSGLWLW